MEKTDFKFRIDETDVIIEAEKQIMEQVIVPIYKPVNGDILSTFIITPEGGFLSDIQNLLPKTLSGDIFQNLMDSLFDTIQNHLNTFGRLAEADMELYAGETMLVMSGVTKAMNLEEPRESEKPEMFKLICGRIMSGMPPGFIN